MSKKNYITLVLSTIGGILFAIGMCMALVEEWSAFVPGVVMGSIGVAVLLAMWIVRRKMEGKPAVRLSGRNFGVVALAVGGALVLGVGMCMVMVWNMMVPGIVVGLIGIIALLGLIPLIKGLE